MSCKLCAAGFPIVNGNHIPTQSLGMIPVTPCADAPQQTRSPKPFKQITVEDFSNPERKAVFTLPTKGDLLVRVELEGGLSVRMEASTLRIVGAAMEDEGDQRQAGNQ
jgi:hypothetical protein